jgi:hypothetical protein
MEERFWIVSATLGASRNDGVMGIVENSLYSKFRHCEECEARRSNPENSIKQVRHKIKSYFIAVILFCYCKSVDCRADFVSSQ